METFSWNQIKAAGEQPSARQGHSISFFPKTRKLLLFGGLDASGAVVKDKAYFLTVPNDITDRWHWQPVRFAGLSRTIGGIMVDRAFHSTSDIGNEKVVVFGGICDEITSKHHSSMLFQCDTTSFSCHEPKVYGEGPCSRYAHSSCSLESGANGREVIIIGGMKSDTREILSDGYVLEVHPTAVRWSKISFHGDLLANFSVAFHSISPVTAGLMAQGNILLFGGKSEKNKKCSSLLSLFPSTHNYSAVSSPTLLARVRTAKDVNGNKFSTRQDFLRQRQDREKMAKG
ncbi:hypothetical protein GUITHDRAFT_106467 [Guillardia theta CCMP2712]|uniref:Uncharacterized protein n=1 Tax=Guillardia theta (strain CCMP2712) TaxID=905079 RepID=L1JIE2_GUITC|nr:hypothetical protein GUITHDRAFT_106467 [Guillardia theta CCMP2712]EKX47919.1 hypothetical protein GUITHDRAFT_106467 [Guillardia theta CCMP2712]|eukprot:XP_005834899.1 hypothetical protein GUITHDRAFT_106467 [Guillardia theta CCMP2712]